MADTTIPRGYPYPTYPDFPMDFPTAIQDLAEAIDADVTLTEDRIAGGFDQPSVRMSAGVGQVIPQNTPTTAEFATGAVGYDNVGMAVLAGSHLLIPEPGIYLLTGRITMTALGSGADYGLKVSFASTAALIPTPASVTRLADSVQDASISLSAVYYTATGGVDQISMQVEHNATAPRTLTFRNMCATKISNITGGS